ncbi:MAG: energy-coupling factor ABC transporter ATP-binding protein [Clostridiales bacterium]|jgi:energy-coupling factor transport system ATP-binding protein|nr:energy-coupling factor ABC transporter ATP-binding protein [Clostridiales bacterium]
MSVDTVIEVKNLSFRYAGERKQALKDLSFTVGRGEFLCIIGPNGAGKSSLCNALVGLIPSYFSGAKKGGVSVLGQDTEGTSVANLASKIGLVFQNPFNQISYTTSTVEEELAYGLCNIGAPRDEMRRRVKEIAETIRVGGLLRKNPLELSGGQIQRVAIGSTLIMRPSILVLDECTTQLDPLGSEEVFDIVKRLNKDGITVVMVDHDMERVARCADRVLVMNDGQLLAIDTPRAIFNGIFQSHGVDMPEYARFGAAMSGAGMYGGPALLTEREAINAGKAAIAV